MLKPVRIVLVGVGGYGHIYLDALTGRNLGAALVGVCDVNPAVAEKFPVLAERKIPVYPSLEAFFAADTADLAIIVSPVHFHTEMVLTCLRRGVHVLCEKPLCLTLGEAHRMEEATRETGKFLSLGYQLNYRKDVLALKRDILAGRYGAPKRLAVYHGFRRGANYYARNNWAGRMAVNGREVFDSPFTNACAHNFQMLTFLLGDAMDTSCDVTGLEAELYRANPQVENYDIAALRFQTDRNAPILYYTAHPIRTACWGPVGVLEFEKGIVRYVNERPAIRGELADGTVIDYTQLDPGDGMQKLLDAIDGVRTGKAPVCGVKADIGHIRAVRMAQEQPIVPVRPELCQPMALDGDRYLCVENLEETFAACAQQWKLPREMGVILG